MAFLHRGRSTHVTYTPDDEAELPVLPLDRWPTGGPAQAELQTPEMREVEGFTWNILSEMLDLVLKAREYECLEPC